MKNLLYIILLISPFFLIAQTPSRTQNYIMSTEYKEGYTKGQEQNASIDEKVTSVIYFDGLGRPIQNINHRAGGQNQDIITYIEYDNFGRMAKEYLPYASTSNGAAYRLNALASTTNFYNTKKYENTTTPYALKLFDSSPLNNVLKQGAPGNDWSTNNLGGYSYYDHAIEFDYKTNTSNEVRNFKITTTLKNGVYKPNISLDSNNGGYYTEGELYKSIIRNENHTGNPNVKENTMEEFKDKQGRVILKRTYGASNNQTNVPHDVYYLYDDFGNLVFVLSPKIDAHTASITSILMKLEHLAYEYRYDTQFRLAEKKIPGKSWEVIIYDRLNRPVMTQDANQKQKKEWSFTKYDVYGRIIYTGIYKHSSDISRKAMQDYFLQQNLATDPFYNYNDNNVIKTYETKPVAGSGYQGSYYTNDDFPKSNIEILAVYYYDNYIFNLEGSFNPNTANSPYYYIYLHGYSDAIPLLKNPTSLQTGSRIRILGTNQWITSVLYYDSKSRLAYKYTKNNYLNTTDKIKTKLDFYNLAKQTEAVHLKTGQNLLILDDYEYDHVGRLISQTQKIGVPMASSSTIFTAKELIMLNTYDELGKLKSKKVGGDVASVILNSAGLQKIDYKYNIRGWLTDINDVQALNNDLFSFKINYNKPTSGTPLFNGNISQTFWRTNNVDDNLKNYRYFYDHLNRITNAYDNTGHYNLYNVSYDKNGNIKRLGRKGAIVDSPNPTVTSNWGNMDYMFYGYQNNGNKLNTITENGDKNRGFKQQASSGAQYVYDKNGNMTQDKNKGITSITYNHLNLPTQVVIDDQNINYTYDATGTKIRKIVNGKIIDYAGNYIYENNQLQFFNHPEGYVTKDGTGFKYVYQYKDHLGNVRLSYTDADKDGVVLGKTSSVFYDDLEGNSPGWNSKGAKYGGSATITTERAYSGTKSIKVHSSNSAENPYSHSNKWIPINNSVATDYIFSGWMYLESPGYIWGRIIFYMNEDDETEYFTKISVGDKIYTKNKWVYIEKRVTVPANIDKVNLRVGLYHNSSYGTAWFDNLSIRKVNTTNEIVEENNYYPFGLEHKGYNNVVNGVENNYHTYNGKELDESLGLNWHDYGARRYDASLGRWMSIDPLADKYYKFSPYVYVGNSPTIAVDPDGKRILFVNGYWNSWIGGIIGSSHPGKKYWGSGFTSAAQRFFGDYSSVSDSNYIDGSSYFGGDSSGGGREKDGYAYAKENYSTLIDGLGEDETFKLVTHSEGGAYGAGIARYLIEKGHTVETILHLSTDEGDEFETPDGPDTYQLSYGGDWVTGNKEISKGVDVFGIVDKYEKKSDKRKYAHGSTKGSSVFKYAKALLKLASEGATGINVTETKSGIKFEIIRDNNKDEDEKN